MVFFLLGRLEDSSWAIFLELLNNEFPRAIVSEIVWLEHLAAEERLQILDGDLSRLLREILLVDLNHFLLRSVSENIYLTEKAEIIHICSRMPDERDDLSSS